MTEKRNGFVVQAELHQVSGTVEREAAKDMIALTRVDFDVRSINLVNAGLIWVGPTRRPGSGR